MGKNIKIFLDRNVFVLWHVDFGMVWFSENIFVEFPELSIDHSRALINFLIQGISYEELKNKFELLEIEENDIAIKKLCEERFLTKFPIQPSISCNIKQIPLCDIFTSDKEVSFSGLIMAHHWCWYFPVELSYQNIREIIRKDLGQLCISKDDQYFRVISCNGGQHLAPSKETRVDIEKYSISNPILINLLEGGSSPISNSAQSLTDKYVGPGKIIKSIIDRSANIPFYMYFAKYSDPDEWDINPHLNCWACGRDENDKLAKTKAIAEAVERYASSQIPIGSIKGSYKEVESAILPQTLIQISQSRLNKIGWLDRFNECNKYLWSRGYEYFSGMTVKILMDLVCYPYYPDYPHIFVANSTGVATHRSIELAIEAATLELIERDAFIVHWLLKKPPRRIKIKSLPTKFNNYVNWLKVNSSSFYLLDFGIDSVPVFGSMAILEGIGLWVSAAADCDPNKAINKAIQELIASIATKSSLSQDFAMPEKIQRVSDHEALYRLPRYQQNAMFLTKGDELSWGDVLEKYRHIIGSITNCVDLLRDLNEPLYIIKLQCDTQEAIAPEQFVTVRVLSPYFVPFYFGEDLIPDASNRLQDIQKRWGCFSLNVCPHPFG